MMCTGLLLMLFFVSALASTDIRNEDVRNLPSHQKKLLKDFLHLQNYLNAEGMKEYLTELIMQKQFVIAHAKKKKTVIH